MSLADLEFTRHEALHTASVLADTISNSLASHTYYSSGVNPLFNQHIDTAIEAINDAYQSCVEENEVPGSSVFKLCLLKVNTELPEIFYSSWEVQLFCNFHKEQFSSLELAWVEYSSNRVIDTGKIVPEEYKPIMEAFVVNDMVVYEASDYHDETRDDVVRCQVDINHPAYIQAVNTETFENEMLRMWSIGDTPVYVHR